MKWKQKYWRTRDGDTLLLKDMDTEHLINIVKFLLKNAQKRKEDVVIDLIWHLDNARCKEDMDVLLEEFERIENKPYEDFIVGDHKWVFEELKRRNVDYKNPPDPMTLLKEMMGQK